MDELNQRVCQTALESLPTGVYLVDRDRRILLWSKGAEELTGYLAQEVVGRCCRDDLLVHCDAKGVCLCGHACPLQETMHDGRPRSADLFLRHKSGRRVAVNVRAVPLHDEHGLIIGAVEWFDRRPKLLIAGPGGCESEPGGAVDELTGLPDRRRMEERLGVFLRIYGHSGIPFGVLSIAVPSLDLVRQTKGYEAVQAALQAVGETITDTVGPGDMVGRWSEQRFVALVTSCTAEGLSQAADTMKRLVSTVGIPWWGDRISVEIAVAGAIVRPGDSAQTLVDRAEQALEAGLQADSVVVV